MEDFLCQINLKIRRQKMKIILFLLASFSILSFQYVFAEPQLFDENLVLEKFAQEGGWGYTAMTFLDDDILVLEKDGFVTLIRDGKIQNDPILKVPVNPIGENGLLGITSVGNTVYLYMTEVDERKEALGNRIYKYEWTGDSLINPELIKELPSNDYHNGGAMVTGLDNQVYAVIGDTGKYGPLQNKLLEELYPPGTLDYMDTSVILRVDPEGPYKAMGIRNSFGLAIDPVTGNLWATENGDDDFDEVNLIPEKFNSGWNKIMGPSTESEIDSLPGYLDYQYDEPEFTWEKVVAPTGIAFAQFKETTHYQNSLFVGDCNGGNLYNFKLNENRDGFEFSNPAFQDKVVNLDESIDDLIIGTGFGCIVDLESGPDGNLYLVTHSDRTIYKISPSSDLIYKEWTSESENGLEEQAKEAGDAIVDAGEETGELIIEAGKEAGEVIVEKGTEAGEVIVETGKDVVDKTWELDEQNRAERQEFADKIEEKGSEVISDIEETAGGGCLIATATFGSELAPQVQELRELRDNKLLQTKSGKYFMNSFNEFYYSFSPLIADYERENPVFRETIKIGITPMISSLSILNHVDMDSEAKVLGYGISLILLNVGMYVGIPAIVVFGIRKQVLSSKND
jgi:glucose/arabinose dehydrogenase